MAFLLASLDALTSVESSILRLAPPVFVPSGGRTHRITSDLDALGVTAGPSTASTFRPASTAEALGAAYVVEGSSLGGMVLARMVGKALALEGRAVGYLTFHGADTGAHWRAFLERLEGWSVAASEEERGAAVRAAKATFGLYRDAFHTAGLLG